MARTDEADLATLHRVEPLTDRVAETVRQAILSGQIPPGTRLSVPKLATQLGVSRTPVREALLLLERDGLVGARAASGMEVLTGDRQGLVEVLEIREVMEGLAARRAAEHMGEEDRARLSDLVRLHHDALEDRDLDRQVDLDADFHRLIRKGAGNAKLSEMLERIEEQVVLINRSLTDAFGFEPRATEKDHRAIIAAIVARDPERAETAMRRHVRRMRDFYRSTYPDIR